jgi:predicted dehydrogenase
MSYKAHYDPHSRYFNPELGGGSLLDLGIYPVFLSTLLFGKPQEIKAGGIVTDSRVDGNCTALLSYKSGQTASIECSFITKTEGIATIYGDKGLIRIRNPWYEKPEGIDVELYEGTKVFHKCEWEGKGLYFEVDEVYNCISNGFCESGNYCHHFSLDVMQTLDELRKQLNVVYPAYE